MGIFKTTQEQPETQEFNKNSTTHFKLMFQINRPLFSAAALLLDPHTCVCMCARERRGVGVVWCGVASNGAGGSVPQLLGAEEEETQAEAFLSPVPWAGARVLVARACMCNVLVGSRVRAFDAGGA